MMKFIMQNKKQFLTVIIWRLFMLLMIVYLIIIVRDTVDTTLNFIGNMLLGILIYLAVLANAETLHNIRVKSRLVLKDLDS